MKKILVPIDFSGDSINALEHAIYISNKVGADISMLHIKKKKNIDTPFYMHALDDEIDKSLQKHFAYLYEKYAEKVKNKLDSHILYGKIYKEIIQFAIETDAYLIVMGTHGTSGFEEFWTGSNAYRVVSRANCPVLTIRNGYNKVGVKKIVLPIDNSEESRQKVTFVTEFASKLKCKVFVSSVRETQSPEIINKLKKHIDQVVDYIENKNVVCEKDALSGNDTGATIIEYAISNKADLIAIVKEQVGNSLSFWYGDHAQYMVNHSPLPILTIPPSR